MKKLLGIELTDKEFDFLICEQNKGKQLKVENGKVIAVEYVPTEEELLKLEQNKRIIEIKSRLSELTQDFIQVQCGAVFEDIDERIAEFQTLHNELRALLGKEPREYTK